MSFGTFSFLDLLSSDNEPEIDDLLELLNRPDPPPTTGQGASANPPPQIAIAVLASAPRVQADDAHPSGESSGQTTPRSDNEMIGPDGGVRDDVEPDDWSEWLRRERPGPTWTTWGDGIYDSRLRRTQGKRQLEGTTVRHCVSKINWVLRRGECRFKVGLASSLSTRWHFYRTDNTKWQPSKLWLLATVETRCGAAFLEAALILYFDHVENGNENRKNCDKGGEGVVWASRKYDAHHVYLATGPFSECAA
jgi:hypothetical protein